VNIVGDHATYHHRYDAPLDSDIHAVASNVSGWIRHCTRPEDVAGDGVAAVAAAMGPPGQVATLVLPADVCWLEGAEPATAPAFRHAPTVADDAVDAAAKALRSGEHCVLLLGGTAVASERGLRAASRIAQGTGASLLSEVFPARLERGAGLPALNRLGYLAEFATAQLEGARHLILVDAPEPVTFFAYPGKPSRLVPAGCEVLALAVPGDDSAGALEQLADIVAAVVEPELQPAQRPDRPTGDLTGETVAAAIGALLPEGAVVADEANTSGLWGPAATAGAPRHSWLTLTGGAIGFGMPVATGAAVACPDQKVLSLEADGSAMYTLQALWTQAREGLDVTTVIFDNHSYAVLNLELSRVGAAEAGPKAKKMLDLTGPSIDFVSLAKGMGVDAVRATTAEDFTAALERGLAEPGPFLIQAPIPGW
jgi:acetolactate synthase-1/2/3 large subunit